MSLRAKAGFLLLALASLGGGALAEDTVQAPAANRPSAFFPAGDASRGKDIATTCLSCHGADEVTADDPPVHPPKLQHQRVGAIFNALQDYRSGQRKSPTMQQFAGSLDDQQMRDVAAYLGGQRRGPPKAVLADGWAHDEVGDKCGFCHGETGMGVMEGYPILSGQNADYLERALAEYRSGARADPTMQTMARSITPDQAHQLAQYFAAQIVLEPAK